MVTSAGSLTAFPEQVLKVRRPAVLRAWMAALYAAATGSTTSYEKIAKAASARRPTVYRVLTTGYRDVLAQLWMLDAVPAWVPTGNAFSRLASAPKHFLADPALAARLLGWTRAGYCVPKRLNDCPGRHLTESAFSNIYDCILNMQPDALKNIQKRTLQPANCSQCERGFDFMALRLRSNSISM